MDMDNVQKIVGYLANEGNVVTDAPVLSISVLVLIIIAVGAIYRRINKGVIASLNARNEAQAAQLGLAEAAAKSSERDQGGLRTDVEALRVRVEAIESVDAKTKELAEKTAAAAVQITLDMRSANNAIYGFSSMVEPVYVEPESSKSEE